MLGLERAPRANAIVRVRRGGIDIDRQDARPTARGHSDQRVGVLAEIPTHHSRIDRRAVHPMRVERLFLADRAYGKDWNACLRERHRSVDDRFSARGSGERLPP